MAEETQYLIPSEIIAGIIGACAAQLFSFLYDRIKDYNKNQSIREMILVDLEMQSNMLKSYIEDFNLFKDYIVSKKYLGGVKFANFIFSDNVYKSNTMIEYHQAFGDVIFNEFQQVYEMILLIKKEPASYEWVDFESSLKSLYASNIQNKDKQRSVLEERCRERVENSIKLCEDTITEIHSLSNKIRNLDFKPFY